MDADALIWRHQIQNNENTNDADASGNYNIMNLKLKLVFYLASSFSH